MRGSHRQRLCCDVFSSKGKAGSGNLISKQSHVRVDLTKERTSFAKRLFAHLQKAYHDETAVIYKYVSQNAADAGTKSRHPCAYLCSVIRSSCHT